MAQAVGNVGVLGVEEEKERPVLALFLALDQVAPCHGDAAAGARVAEPREHLVTVEAPGQADGAARVEIGMEAYGVPAGGAETLDEGFGLETDRVVAQRRRTAEKLAEEPILDVRRLVDLRLTGLTLALLTLDAHAAEMLRRIARGEKRRQGRRRPRRGGVGVGEADGAFGERIEDRARRTFVARHPQVVGAQGVDGDENDIRPLVAGLAHAVEKAGIAPESELAVAAVGFEDKLAGRAGEAAEIDVAGSPVPLEGWIGDLDALIVKRLDGHGFGGHGFGRHSFNVITPPEDPEAGFRRPGGIRLGADGEAQKGVLGEAGAEAPAGRHGSEDRRALVVMTEATAFEERMGRGVADRRGEGSATQDAGDRGDLHQGDVVEKRRPRRPSGRRTQDDADVSRRLAGLEGIFERFPLDRGAPFPRQVLMVDDHPAPRIVAQLGELDRGTGARRLEGFGAHEAAQAVGRPRLDGDPPLEVRQDEGGFRGDADAPAPAVGFVGRDLDRRRRGGGRRRGRGRGQGRRKGRFGRLGRLEGLDRLHRSDRLCPSDRPIAGVEGRHLRDMRPDDPTDDVPDAVQAFVLETVLEHDHRVRRISEGRRNFEQMGVGENIDGADGGLVDGKLGDRLGVAHPRRHAKTEKYRSEPDNKTTQHRISPHRSIPKATSLNVTKGGSEEPPFRRFR